MKISELLSDESKWTLRDGFERVLSVSLERHLIADWNDAPERTFAEVRTLVERLGFNGSRTKN